MFKDRVFNISFLISFCGHILCIFAFGLVIMPKGFIFNKFPTIAFLGPILEQDAFRFDYKLKPMPVFTPYKEDFALDEDMFGQRYDYPSAQALLNKSLAQARFNDTSMQKQIPDFIVDGSSEQKKDIHRISLPPDAKFIKSLVVEGPLTSREIIYRPPLEAIPDWASRQGEEFSIELKISVSSDGIVRAVDRLTTTGNPQIDLIAMRNARGLRFQPSLSAGDKKTIQDGKIKIVLGA